MTRPDKQTMEEGMLFPANKLTHLASYLRKVNASLVFSKCATGDLVGGYVHRLDTVQLWNLMRTLPGAF